MTIGQWPPPQGGVPCFQRLQKVRARMLGGRRSGGRGSSLSSLRPWDSFLWGHPIATLGEAPM